jgi:hypothetical protein
MNFFKYGLIYIYIGLFALILLISCNKEGSPHLISDGFNPDSSIYITKSIIIDDRVKVRDSIFNYNNYEAFLKKLVSTNRFMFVPLNEFDTTFSNDKVIISLRHDIDYDISSAVRFARREHRNGVRATYFILNTADYYSITKRDTLIRKPYVIAYLRKFQDEYKHEIGWHNDLVTLQVVYNIDVEKYLKDELSWLRDNGISVQGTSYHGSEYCYTYHYLNSYLWKNAKYNSNFYCYDTVKVGDTKIKIKKFSLSDFALRYEAEGTLKCDYFFADVFYVNNKRWNMNMFDWNSLKAGDKVIILTHPALWD